MQVNASFDPHRLKDWAIWKLLYRQACIKTQAHFICNTDHLSKSICILISQKNTYYLRRLIYFSTWDSTDIQWCPRRPREPWHISYFSQNVSTIFEIRVGPILMKHTFRIVKETPYSHLAPVLDLLMWTFDVHLSCPAWLPVGGVPTLGGPLCQGRSQKPIFQASHSLSLGVLHTLDETMYISNEKREIRKRHLHVELILTGDGAWRKSFSFQSWRQEQASARALNLSYDSCTLRQWRLGLQWSLPPVQFGKASWWSNIPQVWSSGPF